jgi:transcriptional regulator with XRE-family HTH domain
MKKTSLRKTKKARRFSSSPSGGSLGERMRSFRKSQNLTQENMAHLLGIHFQSVLRYEKGVMTPGADILMKLTELFQLNPSWLLFGHDPQYLPKDDEPSSAIYDASSVLSSSVRVPFADYRTTPPPNALVEATAVPLLKRIAALANLPPKRTQIERRILLPKAWLMHPEETCLVTVQTKALRSSLRPDDMLALDWSDRGASSAEGNIVAVRIGQRIALKRFVLTPLYYLFEDDDSRKPVRVSKNEGSPVLARGLFTMRQT